MRKGIVRLSFAAIARALRLPEGVRVERVTIEGAVDEIKVVISSDDYPGLDVNPEGATLPVVDIHLRADFSESDIG